MKLPIDHKYKLGYRPEIEGIRAIAILLVIAAHAGVEFLEGGFIGVDIFFVLSGYLITGLIVQEIRNTGQLDLLGFYARRLRRLLPALLFMLLLTGLIATIVLSPEEQGAQATSGMMASLWVSNIFFAISDLDYFASGVDSNLYLHTWSLGVEEQFYLVWPLLILFFLGTWKWQGHQHYFLRLRYGMVAIVFTFLLFSIFLTYTKSLWGFYFMPSRAWQFALGAYVFLWTTGDGGSIKGFTHECSSSAWQRIYNFSGFIGLACIVVASVYLDAQKAYPGFWALLPSIGTALILLSIAAIREKGVGVFLSIPPMQWIGKLSYSWYLWHWPILLLGVAVVDESPVVIVISLMVSLFLAVFSYLFVESPIRQSVSLIANKKVTILFSIILMSSLFLLGYQWEQKAIGWAIQSHQELQSTDPSKPPGLGRFQKVRADVPIIYGLGCDEWYHSASVKVCGFGQKNALHTAVLIGDSIGAQWFPALHHIYEKKGWKLLVLTKSSCPMVDEPYFYARIGREYKVCKIWRDSVIEIMKTMSPEVVLIGSGKNYFSHEQWVRGTGKVIDKLAPYVNEVYMIPPTPTLGINGPDCLSRKAWQPDFISQNTSCSTSAKNDKAVTFAKWSQEVADRYQNVHVLDLNDAVCPGETCYAMQDEVVVFRDKSHLTATFVKSLSDTIERQLK